MQHQSMMGAYVTSQTELIELQLNRVATVQRECIEMNKTLNFDDGLTRCPILFDRVACWNTTLAGKVATMECPQYMIGFLKDQMAIKECLSDGTWNDWTNYTNCYNSNDVEVPVTISNSRNKTHLEPYIHMIKCMAQTGYTISFFTLMLALLIMFSIKKLHCARNKLHMHLFASFIMRAGITLLKHMLFVDGVGLNSDILEQNGLIFFNKNLRNGNWQCKLFTSLFNFFITANYSWILMEGLYLYNLIFRSMFADSNKKITQYIILGWGMPLLVISVWAASRIWLSDTFCWTTHDNTISFMIIRIPTAVSILLNMVLFVRIAVVIYSKLQAPNQEEERSYRKWARSTLVLAPLFGIHYAVFLGMSINANETVEMIWLFFDLLFASFQGFVVAILYCFLNSEVRTELKPHMHAFLVFIASNRCLRHLFPCRERYLRSARGRASVCTTMSCSSLFNNGVNHRNSRSGLRSEHAGRSKTDRNKEHVCHPLARHSLPDDSQTRNARSASKQLVTPGGIQGERLGRLSENFTSETFCMLPHKNNHSVVILTPD